MENGRAVAALSAPCPAYRLSEHDRDRVLLQVTETVASINAVLGF
jgi:DNA-binding IclR family transcriptional regulator